MLAKTAKLGSSRVSLVHVCVIVIWPHKSPASEHLPQSALSNLVSDYEQLCRAIRRRVAFEGKQIPIFVLPSCMVRVPSHDILYTSYWFRSPSREILNSISVCP